MPGALTDLRSGAHPHHLQAARTQIGPAADVRRMRNEAIETAVRFVLGQIDRVAGRVDRHRLVLEGAERAQTARRLDAERIAFPDHTGREFLAAEPGVPRRHAAAAVQPGQRAGQDVVGAEDVASRIEFDGVDAASQEFAVRYIDPAAGRLGEHRTAIGIAMPAEPRAGHRFAGATDHPRREAGRQQQAVGIRGGRQRAEIADAAERCCAAFSGIDPRCCHRRAAAAGEAAADRHQAQTGQATAQQAAPVEGVVATMPAAGNGIETHGGTSDLEKVDC